MTTQLSRTAWHDLLTGQGHTGPASAGRPRPTAAPPTIRPASAARHWLTWRRLSLGLELITLGAGYAAPSVIRLALPAAKDVAFAHAAALYHAEQQVHLNVEPHLNHLVSSHPVLALLTGYYYGTLHFILTPLVLAWLYLRKPADFARLRSALVVSTIGANIVFWAWPVAPPRFAVPSMNDLLVTRNILGSADPHGVTSAVNLYAAMPSLHVCWATWCAVAVVTVTRSRWRHLAWLYPAATTFVVLASANHFVLDCIGGLAIAALGLAATRIGPARASADALRPLGAAFQATRPSPETETQAATAPPAGRPGRSGLGAPTGQRHLSQVPRTTPGRAAVDHSRTSGSAGPLTEQFQCGQRPRQRRPVGSRRALVRGLRQRRSRHWRSASPQGVAWFRSPFRG